MVRLWRNGWRFCGTRGVGLLKTGCLATIPGENKLGYGWFFITQLGPAVPYTRYALASLNYRPRPS